MWLQLTIGSMTEMELIFLLKSQILNGTIES